MSEQYTGVLSPLTPEDFDNMMNGAEAMQGATVMPYGMDVVVVPPKNESAQALHCGVDTGDGSGSEDEYPPYQDPNTGAVELLY